MLKDHNAVTPVRLDTAASRSRVKHSTTEPLRSLTSKCLRLEFSLKPNFECFFLSSADFFSKSFFFKRFFQEYHQSVKHVVWIQIRIDNLSVMIWVQTVCTFGYQQTTLVGKELTYLKGGGSRLAKFVCLKLRFFSHPSVKTYVLSPQKICLKLF